MLVLVLVLVPVLALALVLALVLAGLENVARPTCGRLRSMLLRTTMTTMRRSMSLTT